MEVGWVTMGATPTSADVYVDDVLVGSTKDSGLNVDTSKLPAGQYTVKVVLNGVYTQYQLSSVQFDDPQPLFAPYATVNVVINNTSPSVFSQATGFVSISPHTTYEYGPTIVFEDGMWTMFYCR